MKIILKFSRNLTFILILLAYNAGTADSSCQISPDPQMNLLYLTGDDLLFPTCTGNGSTWLYVQSHDSTKFENVLKNNENAMIWRKNNIDWTLSLKIKNLTLNNGGIYRCQYVSTGPIHCHHDFHIYVVKAIPTSHYDDGCNQRKIRLELMGMRYATDEAQKKTTISLNSFNCFFLVNQTNEKANVNYYNDPSSEKRWREIVINDIKDHCQTSVVCNFTIELKMYEISVKNMTRQSSEIQNHELCCSRYHHHHSDKLSQTTYDPNTKFNGFNHHAVRITSTMAAASHKPVQLFHLIGIIVIVLQLHL